MAKTDSFKEGMDVVRAAGVSGAMEAAQRKVDIKGMLKASMEKLGAEGFPLEDERVA